MSGDINFISFNGGVNDGQAYYAQEDIGGAGYNDTVKCSSGLTNFFASFKTVISGSEDAVDVNNLCRNISLNADLWVLRGTMGFTIKGGSQGVRISGKVQGHGKETDVDIGNASDQSHAWTTGVHLALASVDGSPIRVRVLGGDLPTFESGSGPYVYVFPWTWLPFRIFVVKCFLQLRRMGFFKQA